MPANKAGDTSEKWKACLLLVRDFYVIVGLYDNFDRLSYKSFIPQKILEEHEAIKSEKQ